MPINATPARSVKTFAVWGDDPFQSSTFQTGAEAPSSSSGRGACPTAHSLPCEGTSVPVRDVGRRLQHPRESVPTGSVSLATSGSLVRISTGRSAPRRFGGGKRGECCAFSRGARNRARRTLAAVDLKARVLFVTLTVPRYCTLAADPRAFKAKMTVWWKRVERRWPSAAAAWVLEPHESGVPHAHLLVWGIQEKELMRWVGPAWAAVCNTGHEAHARAGTSVEQVRSSRGVQGYLASYLSDKQKHRWGEYRDASGSPVTVGRCWGRMGFIKDTEGKRVWLAPQSPVMELVGTDRAAARMVRLARRMIRANHRHAERMAREKGQKPKRRRLPRDMPAITVISRNVDAWRQAALGAGMIEM